MKIFSCNVLATVAFLVGTLPIFAMADYKDGTTVKCSGSITENGKAYPISSSISYPHDTFLVGGSSVFFDSNKANGVDFGDIRLLIQGDILPTGPNYNYEGQYVVFSLDQNITANHSTMESATYRVAQKFTQARGTQFSYSGSWSSKDNKDMYQSLPDFGDFKFSYNVNCTVMTN